MRRIAPILVVFAMLLAGASYAWASTHPSRHGSDGTVLIALPAAAPHVISTKPLVYGYASETKLARPYRQPAAHGSSSGSSATVVVTATVLPAKTIVVDTRGRIIEVWANGAVAPHASTYLVHVGTASGPLVKLTPTIWAQLRHVFSVPRAPIGEVYG